MARFRTIAELEQMVRWQADQERALLRHTSADLRRAMNQSIQRYRERISDNGHPYFLVSSSGQLTPGSASDPGGTGTKFAWGTLDISALLPAVVRIYGLDVTVDGIISELDAAEFGDRNKYQVRMPQSQAPVAFFGYDENTIGILPACDRPIPYTLWYLPVLPDLLNDDDEFNPGLPGGEEWVVWDVMHKILNRDNYPALIASCRSERDNLMIDLLARASSHQRVGPPKRKDSRGRTRDKRRAFFSGWFVR